ncbi:unnamed protein product [Cuscuta europaea]|uniref:Transposase (putative) gypsy type domain-containing protein n=1 Tax=Cuscuta europaea TaxID=41803 RepID=A0A9P0ZCA3_CUSEU|nr:unnamed protein product [Cuscuta europaea]
MILPALVIRLLVTSSTRFKMPVLCSDVAPLRAVKKQKGGKRRRSGDEVGVLADNGPLEAPCALFDDDWDEARRLTGPTVDIIRPDAGSFVSSLPGFFMIHKDALDHGFRFPLHPFFVEYLNWVGLLPCQITPNGLLPAQLVTDSLSLTGGLGFETQWSKFQHRLLQAPPAPPPPPPPPPDVPWSKKNPMGSISSPAS